MMTPSPELVSAFKHHGNPGPCSLDEARTRCEFILATASELAATLASQEMAPPSRIALADEISALCTAALFAAYGMTLDDDADFVKQPDALTVLKAELQLSEMTHGPLRQMRYRTAEFSISDAPKDTDAFLAHQGSFIAPSLVDWTMERAHEVLAH